jgi:phosphatidylserine decarboxylase
MSELSQIQYYNRTSEKLETEKVYGEGAVRFLYENPLGKAVSNVFASRWLSQAYGYIQDTYISGNKVPPFVKNFKIDMNQYLPGSKTGDIPIENSYKTFNEFFIRGFRDGVRKFPESSSEMGAFAEARYVGFNEITSDLTFPVKGMELTAEKFLNDRHLAREFEGGPLMVARLCPVDYHRYHYPDDGTTEKHFFIRGEFHSVNPLSLKFKDDVLVKNERRVSILNTKNFGKIAYIEVGAVMVGKIIQSHDEWEPFKRGDQKGYFLFGGSTVVIIGQKGQWLPSQDIVENTKNKIETYVQLGDVVGTKV